MNSNITIHSSSLPMKFSADRLVAVPTSCCSARTREAATQKSRIAPSHMPTCSSTAAVTMRSRISAVFLPSSRYWLPKYSATKTISHSLVDSTALISAGSILVAFGRCQFDSQRISSRCTPNTTSTMASATATATSQSLSGLRTSTRSSVLR